MTKVRLLVMVMIAALAVAVAAPVVAAVAPPTNTGFENQSFTSHQRNHFGNPANGFVIIEEWVERDVDGTGAGLVRGCARGFVASQAKRIALRVNLRDVSSGDVLKASGTLNSNGGALVSLCTDSTTIPVGASDDFYVESVATIRWADDTLTSSATFGSTVNRN